MEAIRPGLRSLRAAAFAALCVTLSSTSHVLMAREPLPLGAVAGAFGAVFALAYLLAGRRERGFRAIAALLVPLELAVDTLFTSGSQGCYGPSGGPVTGSWRSFHQAVMCHGTPGQSRLAALGGQAQAALGGQAQQVPSNVLPWLLLAVHVAVGLLASWWLRRGEAALEQVLRAVVAAAFRPLLFAAALVRAAAAAPRPVLPGARYGAAVPLPRALPLRHSVIRRGPPAAAAA
jgi:hypothetical protein